MKRGFLAGLCASAIACGLTTGCDSGGVAVPEERVVTKEDSDAMAKSLQESQKAMQKGTPRR